MYKKSFLGFSSLFAQITSFIIIMFFLRFMSFTFNWSYFSFWKLDYSFEFLILYGGLYSKEQPNLQEQAKDYRFYLIIAALTLWTFKKYIPFLAFLG